ncbi:MAG: winged helix-turn-helix domain-containing protein [Acidobacteriota bacterium]
MSKRFQIFEWSVNVDTNTLTSKENSVRIEPKVMAVLIYLAEHAGEVIPKERIIQSVWEEKFITDEVLTVSIHELRKALGDDAKNPRFIKTIPRAGYQFIAPVSDSERKASLARSVRPSRRWVFAAAAVLGAAALILALIFSTAKPAPQIKSIAVLPLENLSADADQGFFADGMTDALITNLARVGSLRVISRTSVMKYKEAKKPLPEIAKELNVDAIVEGTIVRAGNQVRINVQLIDAATDRHLWAEKYERNLSDVIALQNEVSLAVTRQIGKRLDAQRSLPSSQPVDSDVYEAYLKGRYFWNQRTQEGARKSVEYFEQAISRDPAYAPAYAGLSDTYTLGDGGLLGVARDEAYRKATAAARRAIELDPSLAEAHSSLAAIKFQYEWDWEGADEEFKKAIALNPNSSIAHMWYGELLSATGRHEEAIETMEQARRLDPLDAMINSDLAWIYYMARRFDLALEQSRKTLELDPSLAWVHWMMGTIYYLKGMEREAVEAYKKTLTMTGAAPERLSAIADTRGIFKWWLDADLKRGGNNAPLVMLYAALGEKEKALDRLEHAYQSRRGMLWLKVNPALDPLRSEVRFKSLLQRLGLES